jgi:hypothetical protein
MHEGLLIDVGGVLTTDVIAAFDEYCAREGLLGISIRDLYYNSAEAQRLFRRLELGEIDAVEALHASGVRTGVLSNSWWFPIYDDPFYERAFDVQLISGHVGLRKPDPRMFGAASPRSLTRTSTSRAYAAGRSAVGASTRLDQGGRRSAAR